MIHSSVTRNNSVAIAILGLASVGGFILGQSNAPEPLYLEVAPGSLQLGSVWETSDFECVLPIRNVHSRLVEVKTIEASCSCIKVEPLAFALAPGETTNVRVRIDLRESGEDFSPRPFAFSLLPTIAVQDTTTKQEPWLMEGEVRRSIVARPPVLRFPPGITRGSPSPTEQVRVLASPNVATLKAVFNKAYASVVVTSAAGSEKAFNVAISLHTAETGNRSFDITLIPQTKDGPLPPFTLPVIAKVVEVVELVPDTLVLGPRHLGEYVEELVLLRSRTKTPFLVLGVECSANVSAANRGTACSISTKVTKRGSNAETVVFMIQSKNEPGPVSIPLRILYYGIDYDRK